MRGLLFKNYASCMRPPKVSVIIPTYNRAWAIRRSVESVLGQTFQDFELLIVDDGSTDQTPEILQTFQHHPHIQITRTANRGVSLARNTALKKARGEWIAFLDSDDEWTPHKLQCQWDYLQKWPQLKVIHGEEIWIRRGVRVNPKQKHAKSGGELFQKCLPLCLISPSAVMIHRKVFRQIGLFDPQMTVCEDYDLWLRMTPFYRVGFVAEPIVKKYGGHSDQLSVRYKAMDYFRVKSIDKVLQLDIGPENRRKAKETLLEKSRILLRGYHKYQNWAAYHEIAALTDRVRRSVDKIPDKIHRSLQKQQTTNNKY